MRSPARAYALAGSSEAVSATQAIYCGVTLRETGGANPAVVQLYDNAAAAAGTLLDTIQVPAGESVSLFYEQGVWAKSGIWAEISGTGAVEGSVRVG